MSSSDNNKEIQAISPDYGSSTENLDSKITQSRAGQTRSSKVPRKEISQKNNESNPSPKRKSLAIVEVQQALRDWYDLRFNEIKHVVEGRKKDERDFKDIDNENNMLIQLLNNGYRISSGILCALLNSEFVAPYNPFKEYFESLPHWYDIDDDFIENLANHINARDQVEFNHHFKKMLVRTISCAIDDHSFNKHAFILVGGKQHTGKSTFCRFLCPPALHKYLSENITLDKDGLISLSQSFIINLDELSTLSKFEINHLKSLFSKDSVSVRHPFARKSQTDPRRASFVGSTNEDTFLTDSTGSVRWLCFEIDSIDWDYSSNINIDHVWGQAYTLYKEGFRFQLTSEELKENENRNQQFQRFPMEYEYIQQYLSPGTESDHTQFMTSTEIKDHIISKSDRKADIRSTEKLGKALVQLGFARTSKRISEKGHPVYGYYINFLI